MAPPKPFHAAIQIPAVLGGQIVTDRVACRRPTCVLEKKPADRYASARKAQYQQHFIGVILAACNQTEVFSQKTVAIKVVRQFLALAQTLKSSKALAFLFDMVDREEDRLDASEDEDESNTNGSPCPGHASERPQLPTKHAWKDNLHPLLVALIAFHYGGPVNAAFTAEKHEWKIPDDFAKDQTCFYSEGDGGSIFDGLQITKVWETRDGKTRGPSGNHSVFLTGETQPRQLVAVDAQDQDFANSPATILYDSSGAALYYDCQGLDAVRKSISLNFYLNVITDNEIQLMGVSSQEYSCGRMSLTELVTNFPVPDYTARFHSLLFDPASLSAILTKLSSIHMPPPSALRDHSQSIREESFIAYKSDSLTHLPFEIREMDNDVTLNGVYPAPANFLDNVVLKARRDLHLPVGMNLIPQFPIEENQDAARKFIRDLPKYTISMRIAHYAPNLLAPTYTLSDLVSTSDLQKLAGLVERRCLELVGIGFVDESSCLLSMATLAHCFGAALNGLKEIDTILEPCIDEIDLQVYRTRCLYLFWSADWLTCYLEKPIAGPLMIADLEETGRNTAVVIREIHRVACILLRNWVAWGMFVEGLPQERIFVRRGCQT
ncbi:hypothetical protein DDE82_002055 [Stemphylium lycopersici]|nr:hypothetical protein TW65_04759 [Stemphylium lycopersici]RAR08766.1 hypothetical protein DDE82_002055 [Stemphylium lycopersici]